MVVNDFCVVYIAIYPAKTDAPLIVDPNAVLSAPIAFELLQAVIRRDAQLGDTRCIAHHPKFPSRRILNIWG